MNLLIYYNANQKNFYIVYTDFIPFDKRVGYENGYGHVLIQILARKGKKYVNIIGRSDLLRFNYKESFKSRLAGRLMRWLNKYRE